MGMFTMNLDARDRCDVPLQDYCSKSAIFIDYAIWTKMGQSDYRATTPLIHNFINRSRLHKRELSAKNSLTNRSKSKET